MKRSPFDWLASLMVPGWTQLMYLRFVAAAFFLIAALIVWITVWTVGSWWLVLSVHAGAALHGIALCLQYRATFGGFDVPDPRVPARPQNR